MKDITTRAQYDAAAQQLVGFKLDRVTYFEIEYEIGEPCYLHQAQIGHFLDFGLEFRMTGGDYRSFLWDGTFYQYGVGIYGHAANREVNTNRQWDVSETDDWHPFIGSTIIAVNVYWSQEGFVEYPQDLRLAFSCHRHIYLSASQYLHSSDRLSGMSDDILVIFDEAVAMKYKVGPHAIDA
ncbi:hypothetical protein OAF98_00550 [Planctomicrobium sp.]|jgi:hypothetical protein|nr:hypothetical protein [Planctomicrobium sp.]MBT5018382.1 hypothetical protein [Planctomicrobium sp.]MDB4742947.1 hypothetical protein [Planctomicrobium sp.]